MRSGITDDPVKHQLRKENRLLRQELSAQRRLIDMLRTELKNLGDKVGGLEQIQQHRCTDLELTLYTMADKYMPGCGEFLDKGRH